MQRGPLYRLKARCGSARADLRSGRSPWNSAPLHAALEREAAPAGSSLRAVDASTEDAATNTAANAAANAAAAATFTAIAAVATFGAAVL